MHLLCRVNGSGVSETVHTVRLRPLRSHARPKLFTRSSDLERSASEGGCAERARAPVSVRMILRDNFTKKKPLTDLETVRAKRRSKEKETLTTRNKYFNPFGRRLEPLRLYRFARICSIFFLFVWITVVLVSEVSSGAVALRGLYFIIKSKELSRSNVAEQSHHAHAPSCRAQRNCWLTAKSDRRGEQGRGMPAARAY
ncbi:hypothetical protein Baya_10347 [Bagarius yarrelli]|uniref:Uncharacterized protein n=1 Tax=Bagarius yarrelli TaxID=175774 RepID=A0A556UYS4_BAGYA|nr:hypothetical protein Baya_10347 [Bagarius yarrelli]